MGRGNPYCDYCRKREEDIRERFGEIFERHNDPTMRLSGEQEKSLGKTVESILEDLEDRVMG